jgi:hypothetical protein
VYVSPLVESGNTFRIWAEVANEQEDDQWLLRPGQTAQMTIHTRQPVERKTAAANADQTPTLAEPIEAPNANTLKKPAAKP